VLVVLVVLSVLVVQRRQVGDDSREVGPPTGP
jgi:hypothetical protein